MNCFQKIVAFGAVSSLSATGVMATPSQTTAPDKTLQGVGDPFHGGRVELSKEYIDGSLNVGEHGFLLNISTLASTYHSDYSIPKLPFDESPSTQARMFAAVVRLFRLNNKSDYWSEATPASQLPFQEASTHTRQRLKADVRLFSVNKVLLDGRVEAVAARFGPGLKKQQDTRAETSLRVMGSEILSNVGGAATDNITVSNAREISKTFFERDGDVSVYFIDVNVKLKARGTLNIEATAVSENGDPKSGSARSKMAATADLTTVGTVSAGIDYVARVEAKGTVKLVELSFTPTMMATRKFDDRDSVPVTERGIYTVNAVAPLNVTGLDGKLTVGAYVGGVRIPFIGPLEVKVAETTVWDPDPLVSFNKNLDSRTKTEAFRATFL